MYDIEEKTTWQFFPKHDEDNEEDWYVGFAFVGWSIALVLLMVVMLLAVYAYHLKLALNNAT